MILNCNQINENNLYFLMVIKFLGLEYILISLDLTTQANGYAFLLA